MVEELKNFLFRGNIVELGVAFVLGVAFAAGINSQARGWLGPPTG
jgi:large-conductance mechanosensitive channel